MLWLPSAWKPHEMRVTRACYVVVGAHTPLTATKRSSLMFGAKG